MLHAPTCKRFPVPNEAAQKRGQMRMCIIYQAINSFTSPVNYAALSLRSLEDAVSTAPVKNICCLDEEGQVAKSKQ